MFPNGVFLLQGVDKHCSSSAPVRVEGVSGLVLKDNLILIRPFPEDGRKAR